MNSNFEFQIGEDALFEIKEAYSYYESKIIGLGDQFIAELDQSFEEIRKTPFGYKKVNNHHQYPMKRFPFLIMYEPTSTCIYIDAVFHTSRFPREK